MNAEAKKTYDAEVVEVFSGDDLVMLVDLGAEDLYKKQRVRLKGVDTPNAVRSAADTPAGQVRTYVRNLCKGRKVSIDIESRGAGSWVVVAHVHTADGLHNLNEDLIAQGFGYQRETKQ